MVKKILIVVIIVGLASVAWRLAIGADDTVPKCGQSPLTAPPSTAEFCDELPPPGFHAGVAWQTDEYLPGHEEEIVRMLELKSYYNWQPYPRSLAKYDEPRYWDLAVLHVPMYYDPIAYSESYKIDIPPTQCEFTLYWNEPDVYQQANRPAGEVALANVAIKDQQTDLCYRHLPEPHSNFGSLGTLLVNIDNPSQAHNGYVAEYLDAGGPVPDAWAQHIYAGTWEEFLFWWNQIERVMDEYPELDRPVILTEVASTHEDIAERKRFMSNLAHLIATNDRLHSAYWFVAEGWNLYPEIYTLVTVDLQFTELGEHFMFVRGRCSDLYIPSMSSEGMMGSAASKEYHGPVECYGLPTSEPTGTPQATNTPTKAHTPTATATDAPEPVQTPTETLVPTPTKGPCSNIPVIPPPACYNGSPNPPPFCPCYEG